MKFGNMFKLWISFEMNPNQFTLILPVLVNLLSVSFARGPHHPRGEAVIVKRHTHYTPGKKAEKITQDVDLLQDKEHLKEHLDEVAPKVDLSKMTDAELELYYFLLHDTDKNSKLDGLELLNAILHTTHEDGHEHAQDEELMINVTSQNDSHGEVSDESFSHFVELVDQVLKEDDKNQDGYLDYAEYVEGRKKAERLLDKRPSVKMT